MDDVMDRVSEDPRDPGDRDMARINEQMLPRALEIIRAVDRHGDASLTDSSLLDTYEQWRLEYEQLLDAHYSKHVWQQDLRDNPNLTPNDHDTSNLHFVREMIELNQAEALREYCDGKYPADRDARLTLQANFGTISNLYSAERVTKAASWVDGLKDRDNNDKGGPGGRGGAA